MTTTLDNFQRAAIRVYNAMREIKICIDCGYYMSLRDCCQRYNIAFFDMQVIAHQLTYDKIEDLTPDYDLDTLTIRWRSGVEMTYNCL